MILVELLNAIYASNVPDRVLSIHSIVDLQSNMPTFRSTLLDPSPRSWLNTHVVEVGIARLSCAGTSSDAVDDDDVYASDKDGDADDAEDDDDEDDVDKEEKRVCNMRAVNPDARDVFTISADYDDEMLSKKMRTTIGLPPTDRVYFQFNSAERNRRFSH